jgi:alcohol dehydrogenase
MSSQYRFHCPVKIVSGENAINKLAGEFRQLGARRPMIITDPGVAQAGLLALVHQVLENTDVALGATYDRVPADSPISTILEIEALYNQNGCDSLLAIGGGSAIDTAKGVKIKLAEPSIDLLDFKAVLRMVKPTVPLVVIPTTAGTGSEVTSAAVLSDNARGIKMSLISPAMPPNTAVIDPHMTATLPPRLTASTGMDALVHAVESYLGSQKNPISDALAASAVKLIAGNIVEAVRDGRNLKARMAMANAATMAGVAFSNSMVTMVHAVGHALGAVCHVPHGDAMAVCLPDVLEFNLDVVGEEVGELLQAFAGAAEYAGTPRSQRAGRVIDIIRNLRSSLNALCGLPFTLEAVGVAKEKLSQVSEVAVKDGAAFYNRKKFTSDDVYRLLEKMQPAG